MRNGDLREMGIHERKGKGYEDMTQLIVGKIFIKFNMSGERTPKLDSCSTIHCQKARRSIGVIVRTSTPIHFLGAWLIIHRSSL